LELEAVEGAEAQGKGAMAPRSSIRRREGLCPPPRIIFKVYAKIKVNGVGV